MIGSAEAVFKYAVQVGPWASHPGMTPMVGPSAPRQDPPPWPCLAAADHGHACPATCQVFLSLFVVRAFVTPSNGLPVHASTELCDKYGGHMDSALAASTS